MKRYLILFVLFVILPACSTSGPVHVYSGKPRSLAEVARLQVPGPISVTKIDHAKVEVPSQESGFYEIFLLPGIHRVDFKYSLYWGDPTSGMMVSSDEVGVDTMFHAGKTYRLTYKEPGDLDEAYNMARSFQAQLLELGTGRNVTSRSLEVLNERGVRTSLTSVPLQAAVSETRVKDVPLPQETDNAKDAVTVPPGIDANTAAKEDAVKRLKFWWLMANEEERKLFLQWTQSLPKPVQP